MRSILARVNRMLTAVVTVAAGNKESGTHSRLMERPYSRLVLFCHRRLHWWLSVFDPSTAFRPARFKDSSISSSVFFIFYLFGSETCSLTFLRLLVCQEWKDYLRSHLRSFDHLSSACFRGPFRLSFLRSHCFRGPATFFLHLYIFQRSLDVISQHLLVSEIAWHSPFIS